MRKISADFILTPSGILSPGLTLLLDNDESVVDLIANNNNDTEYYEGVVCPGFINTHCHLELSFMKDKISRGNHLDGFIREFVATRKTLKDGITEAIIAADKKMWEEGIQGVGDICNNDSTFSVKQSSNIRYHSFVEIFNFDPSQSKNTFDDGILLVTQALQSHRYATVNPHAPYSVPPALFTLIKGFQETHPSRFTIHNQETAGENEMFLSGNGTIVSLFQSMGIDMSWFQKSETNSLPAISKYFPENVNRLLVHNTFTRLSDITFLKENNYFKDCWFCLCPNANLYIESRLPDVEMLYHQNCKLTLGTDSLASNDSLSILDEIKTLHQEFPSIPLEKMLIWATKNGADYFGWNDLGSFQKGSRPGVLQITNCSSQKINNNAVVKRLA